MQALEGGVEGRLQSGRDIQRRLRVDRGRFVGGVMAGGVRSWVRGRAECEVPHPANSMRAT